MTAGEALAEVDRRLAVEVEHHRSRGNAVVAGTYSDARAIVAEVEQRLAEMARKYEPTPYSCGFQAALDIIREVRAAADTGHQGGES